MFFIEIEDIFQVKTFVQLCCQIGDYYEVYFMANTLTHNIPKWSDTL